MGGAPDASFHLDGHDVSLETPPPGGSAGLLSPGAWR